MRTQSLLLFAFLFLAGAACAQNDIIVFAEEGEKFTLFVNSVQQNETPSANVRAEGLTGEGALLRVVFEDAAEAPLKKQIQFLEKNTEITTKITMTKKGYKIRYVGAAPIASEPVVVEDNVVVFEEVPAADVAMQTTTVTKVVSTTTEVDVDEAADESVNMNVDVNGFKLKLDVNVDGMDMDAGSSTTTTTTTTVTTSEPAQSDDALQDHSVVLVDPCVQRTSDIASIRSAMEDESFADDKMNVAKQALRDQCIYVNGIKELAEQFSFEDDKLDFVKYCYDRCADRENYYQLNAVFTFSSNKEALNEFLNSQK